MTKNCNICKSELFEDEKGELFCPDCEANKFSEIFNENDDSWMNNKFKILRPNT
ncbi:MAG: hypothetical protein WCG23_07475 [bacterium]